MAGLAVHPTTSLEKHTLDGEENRGGHYDYIYKVMAISPWWYGLPSQDARQEQRGGVKVVRCGGNTQGSGAYGSNTEPLNNFIDRFCSLQLPGHTTPYFSLQSTTEPLHRVRQVITFTGYVP